MSSVSTKIRPDSLSPYRGELTICSSAGKRADWDERISRHATALIRPTAAGGWAVSATHTTHRLLEAISILRIFLNYPGQSRSSPQCFVRLADSPLPPRTHAQIWNERRPTRFCSTLRLWPTRSVRPLYRRPWSSWRATASTRTVSRLCALGVGLCSHLCAAAEVSQAARTLFGTYLAALTDAEVQALVQIWADRRKEESATSEKQPAWELTRAPLFSAVPSRQTFEGVLHHRADHALLLTGLVAIDRLLLLSAPYVIWRIPRGDQSVDQYTPDGRLLKDIATSIEYYLQDHGHPYHQAVATELCSRGFAIWQNYVDAMSLTRHLFALAIGSNPATSNDLRTLARNATLHVAGVNTPLLMTTLLFDILNTPDASSRNATLRLLGFMIRKVSQVVTYRYNAELILCARQKPLVIHTNLPRIVDAVVKCLDPAVTSLRETVQQAATAILNELVKT